VTASSKSLQFNVAAQRMEAFFRSVSETNSESFQLVAFYPTQTATLIASVASAVIADGDR